MFIVSEAVQKTRGFRNNNPGNVRRGQSWLGLRSIQTDPAFDQFIAPEFGIRAIKILLRNYQQNYGLRTIRQLISRYAPGHENPTDAYVANVASIVGVSPDASIDVNQYMPEIVTGIIRQEIGAQPYPQSILVRGLVLADDSVQATTAARNLNLLPSYSLGMTA